MDGSMDSAPELRAVILGVPISIINMQSALDIISSWVSQKQSRFITAVDVHGVMTAQSSPTHLQALRSADMVTPDGLPLVWVGRARGHREMGRVAGPDLIAAVCEQSAVRGWRNYFYGGAPHVVQELSLRLKQSYPGLIVVGVESPPFRPLTDAEKRETARRINESRADIVWVGLGCPKQERWISDMKPLIERAVLIAVGAAFDFHSGNISRAPRWMQRSGFEWLHRLCSEPRRLWRRYLVLAPSFVAMAVRESLISRGRPPSA